MSNVRNGAVLVFAAATGVVAWGMTYCRFDVVGFTLFLVAAALAIAGARQRGASPIVRLLPPLVVLGGLGACFAIKGVVDDEGRVVGAAIVDACTRAGTCPAAPDGFVAETIPPPFMSARRVVAGGRASIRYTRGADARGFRLRVMGPIDSRWYVGGVGRPLEPLRPASTPDAGP